MCKFWLQLKKPIISFIGFILIPAVFISMEWIMHEYSANISGLLAQKEYWLISHLFFLILLAWSSILILKIQPSARKKIILLDLLACAALFIPYTEGSSLLSSLHLFFSYESFVWFNLILYQLWNMDQILKQMHLATIIFIFLLCLQAEAISGTAEAVYACAMSIFLTMKYKKTAEE